MADTVLPCDNCGARDADGLDETAASIALAAAIAAARERMPDDDVRAVFERELGPGGSRTTIEWR